MIGKHIKYKIHLIILLVTLVSNAQQDPQYTQYMYNMSVINPGYATDDAEVINFGALYRAQWVGSEGGPTTGTFFAHSPIAKKVEMGISVVHDEIGDVVKESNVFVDFAYVLNLNESNKLSFGIKGGATFYSTNFNGFIYSDELPDPAFAENLSKTFPNIGVGAFYFGENYYLGLSSPNLLKSKHLEKQDGVIATGVEEIHYFFTGGYVFNLNDNLKFKPAFMTKAVAGAPMSLDLTANFLINNVFEIGAGYRWDDSVSGLVNFKISPSLRIGYAYDYGLSELNSYSSGSHEISLGLVIGKNYRNNTLTTPRYF